MNKEEQFSAWVLEQAKDTKDSPIEDIIEGLENMRGDSVAPYYHQINEIYEVYEDVLWHMLTEYHSDIGSELSPLEMLNEMNQRYSGQKKAHIIDMQGVKQWLVWFGIENAAHSLVSLLDE